MGVFKERGVATARHSLSLSSSAKPHTAAPITPKRGRCPHPSEPLGSCELFMPVVFRGAAIGGVLALVVQACGPTPLGAMVRGALAQPIQASQSTAVTEIQTDLHSLQSLPFAQCHDAVCAGR